MRVLEKELADVHRNLKDADADAAVQSLETDAAVATLHLSRNSSELSHISVTEDVPTKQAKVEYIARTGEQEEGTFDEESVKVEQLKIAFWQGMVLAEELKAGVTTTVLKPKGFKEDMEVRQAKVKESVDAKEWPMARDPANRCLASVIELSPPLQETEMLADDGAAGKGNKAARSVDTAELMSLGERQDKEGDKDIRKCDTSREEGLSTSTRRPAISVGEERLPAQTEDTNDFARDIRESVTAFKSEIEKGSLAEEQNKDEGYHGKQLTWEDMQDIKTHNRVTMRPDAAGGLQSDEDRDAAIECSEEVAAEPFCDDKGTARFQRATDSWTRSEEDTEEQVHALEQNGPVLNCGVLNQSSSIETRLSEMELPGASFSGSSISATRSVDTAELMSLGERQDKEGDKDIRKCDTSREEGLSTSTRRPAISVGEERLPAQTEDTNDFARDIRESVTAFKSEIEKGSLAEEQNKDEGYHGKQLTWEDMQDIKTHNRVTMRPDAAGGLQSDEDRDAAIECSEEVAAEPFCDDKGTAGFKSAHEDDTMPFSDSFQEMRVSTQKLNLIQDEALEHLLEGSTSFPVKLASKTSGPRNSSSQSTQTPVKHPRRDSRTIVSQSLPVNTSTQSTQTQASLKSVRPASGEDPLFPRKMHRTPSKHIYYAPSVTSSFMDASQLSQRSQLIDRIARLNQSEVLASNVPSSAPHKISQGRSGRHQLLCRMACMNMQHDGPSCRCLKRVASCTKLLPECDISSKIFVSGFYELYSTL